MNEVIEKSDIVIAAVPANKTRSGSIGIRKFEKIKYMWTYRHQLQTSKNKWQTK
ncbi:hypothetical protein ACEQPO_27920 [Bacillus sp. SL00103]